MMGKLATRDNGTNRQFKCLNARFIRAEEEDKVGNFMIDTIMINEIIKIGTDQIVVTGKISVDKMEVDQGMNKIIGEEILEITWEHTEVLEDRIVEENIEVIIGMKIMKSRSRERSFSRNINNRRNDRSINNGRSRSGSRVSINRDRVKCYKCREYDHFVKDCPTSKEEREIEQIQQMFTLDEEHTLLKC